MEVNHGSSARIIHLQPDTLPYPEARRDLLLLQAVDLYRRLFGSFIVDFTTAIERLMQPDSEALVLQATDDTAVAIACNARLCEVPGFEEEQSAIELFQLARTHPDFWMIIPANGVRIKTHTASHPEGVIMVPHISGFYHDRTHSPQTAALQRAVLASLRFYPVCIRRTDAHEV